MQSSEIPELITPEQAAEMLNVPLSTLQYLRRKQQGPEYYKIGPAHNALIRYPKQEFLDWFESSRVTFS